jgi:glycosyltransferase involved in cell wall biosynthesis
MKFCLIGPGIQSIPPKGWGAVESLMWEYSEALKKLGHYVDIINIPNREEIIKLENAGQYDISHLHYDVFHEILPELKAKKIFISSHYPYIEQLHRHHQDSYVPTMQFMVRNSHRFNIAAISSKDRQTYLNFGVDHNDIFLIPNGVNIQKITYRNDISTLSSSAVCLAKIEPRKRQDITKNLPNVFYIGKGPFDHPNYLGELIQEAKEDMLTNFGSMILLSDGENGTPLAIKEGMAAGLNIIVSEFAASEIKELPFVQIIPEPHIRDEKLIARKILESNYNNLQMRPMIRKYCEDNWSWTSLVEKYVDNVNKQMQPRYRFKSA